MRTLPLDLSLTALALLGAIVDYQDIDTGRLRDFVPQPLDEQHSWIDELQGLINRRLVIRVEGPGCYLYRATEDGVSLLRAYLHPDGRRWSSAS